MHSNYSFNYELHKTCLLYTSTENAQLVPTGNSIEEEWSNIRDLLEKVVSAVKLNCGKTYFINNIYDTICYTCNGKNI